MVQYHSFNSNSDSANYGDRIYAIWVNLYATMDIWFQKNGEMSKISMQLTNTPVMEWTRINVTQKLTNGKYILNIFVAKTKAYSIKNINPIEYKDVKLYLGDPWYPVQPGFIRNLFTDAISSMYQCCILLFKEFFFFFVS